jgi:hypothetical protein
MAVPYTFGSATTSIPLSQLDSNFATGITLGNTSIQLGNTVTTLNNMTMANVTVSSGNVVAGIASSTITQSMLASGVAGNGPAFSAYAGTTTTLTANTDVKVAFNTELFDTANCFSSSRFTPNVAGYYIANVCLQVNYWSGIIFSAIVYKNGSAYQNGQTAYPQSTGGVRASISTLVYLNGTTDYIEGYGYQYATSSNNDVAASINSTFSACLVRSA